MNFETAGPLLIESHLEGDERGRERVFRVDTIRVRKRDNWSGRLTTLCMEMSR